MHGLHPQSFHREAFTEDFKLTDARSSSKRAQGAMGCYRHVPIIRQLCRSRSRRRMSRLALQIDYCTLKLVRQALGVLGAAPCYGSEKPGIEYAGYASDIRAPRKGSCRWAHEVLRLLCSFTQTAVDEPLLCWSCRHTRPFYNAIDCICPLQLDTWQVYITMSG